MSFAVVQFSADETYSEVPLSWLTSDRRSCYWPSKAKNASLLMKKGVQPDPATWDAFEIKLEGVYSSLSKARRKAENAESSTEDDDLGKGRRKRIRSAKLSQGYSTDESSDYEDRYSSSPPPKLPSPKHSANTYANKQSVMQLNMDRNQTIIKPLNCSDDILNSSSSSVPKLLSTQHSGIENITNTYANTQSVMQLNMDRNHTIIKPLNCSDDVINSAEIIIETVNVANDPRANNEDILVAGVTPTVTPTSDTPLTEPVTSAVINKLLDMYSSVNLMFQTIDDRLKKIESSCLITTVEIMDDELKAILDMLPLKNIETVERFEQIISDNDNITPKLIKYVNGIGGHHIKDNIHRILKRIFSNGLGVQCSWLGLRNNYKVCTLRIIQIIKDVVLKNYTGAKEKEIENIISEWFRLSKLRLQRQK